jgi:hypothetical protein
MTYSSDFTLAHDDLHPGETQPGRRNVWEWSNPSGGLGRDVCTVAADRPELVHTRMLWRLALRLLAIHIRQRSLTARQAGRATRQLVHDMYTGTTITLQRQVPAFRPIHILMSAHHIPGPASVLLPITST